MDHSDSLQEILYNLNYADTMATLLTDRRRYQLINNDGFWRLKFIKNYPDFYDYYRINIGQEWHKNYRQLSRLLQLTRLELSKTKYHVVDADAFWRLKFQQDHGFLPDDVGQSWSEIYKNYKAVYVEGANSQGQLGIDDDDYEYGPTLTDLNGNLVVCGSQATFVVDFNSDVWVTGINERGQLGLGHTDPVREFVKNPYLKNIKAISCYMDTVLFLNKSGDLWFCGNDISLPQLIYKSVSMISGNVFLSDGDIYMVFGKLNVIPLLLNEKVKKVSQYQYFVCYVDEADKLSWFDVFRDKSAKIIDIAVNHFCMLNYGVAYQSMDTDRIIIYHIYLGGVIESVESGTIKALIFDNDETTMIINHHNQVVTISGNDQELDDYRVDYISYSRSFGGPNYQHRAFIGSKIAL